eukprot:scaffold3917_cov377-Prasinococcus_capsulatus_cf.AAC.19
MGVPGRRGSQTTAGAHRAMRRCGLGVRVRYLGEEALGTQGRFLHVRAYEDQRWQAANLEL